MLSLAAVVGLLMALAVALEGGPRMIAALSIHLAVLVGVAAGSRVEGRATLAGPVSRLLCAVKSLYEAIAGW